MNEIKYKQDIQELNKIIEDKEKKEKDLKQEFAQLKKYLRHLPPDRQVHVYKDIKVSSNQS
jgi:cell division protein FtsL